MNYFKNEKGATLLLVLLGSTLVILFIMFLMAQELQLRKQVTYAEKDIDSRNIARMGIEWYEAEVLSRIDDRNLGIEITDGVDEDIERMIADIKEKLEKEINLIGPDCCEKVTLDANHSYQIKDVKFPEEFHDREGILQFTSVGEAFGRKKELDGDIVIRLDD